MLGLFGLTSCRPCIAKQSYEIHRYIYRIPTIFIDIASSKKFTERYEKILTSASLWHQNVNFIVKTVFGI